MSSQPIQDIFELGWDDFVNNHYLDSQRFRVGNRIRFCKKPEMGQNASVCSECGYIEFHNNSCRDRNCPCCQAVKKEKWVDARSSEVIDSTYFHGVFTLPSELYPLIYANQRVLYDLMHKASAECIKELAADKKYIGGEPAIMQVLHTWNQELLFHPHIHCIISGGCLSFDKQHLIERGDKFFLPVKVVSRKFRGKFLHYLKCLRKAGRLKYSSGAYNLRNSYEWQELIDKLYDKEWVFYIKETINSSGNAIKYLGNYTNRIAISNARIKSVSEDEVVFSARDSINGGYKDIHLSIDDFISRFMLHVLPKGFVKIRYYGFINNRSKAKNLKVIFRIQGHRRFMARYADMSVAEIIMDKWGRDITLCPCCGKSSMIFRGRLVPKRE